MKKLFIVFIALSSCAERTLPVLSLPSEQIILSRGTVALVTRNYARVFALPDPQSVVIAPVRKGDIGLIQGADAGQSVVNRILDYWYEVRFEVKGGEIQGWIFGSDIELFSTQARAQSAAAQQTEPLQ